MEANLARAAPRALDQQVPIVVITNPDLASPTSLAVNSARPHPEAGSERAPRGIEAVTPDSMTAI
jgi:hypothetical protein